MNRGFQNACRYYLRLTQKAIGVFLLCLLVYMTTYACMDGFSGFFDNMLMRLVQTQFLITCITFLSDGGRNFVTAISFGGIRKHLIQAYHLTQAVGLLELLVIYAAARLVVGLCMGKTVALQELGVELYLITAIQVLMVGMTMIGTFVQRWKGRGLALLSVLIGFGVIILAAVCILAVVSNGIVFVGRDERIISNVFLGEGIVVYLIGAWLQKKMVYQMECR